MLGYPIAAITALRDALAQEPVTQMRGNALARWAHEQEEPPDTDWQRGYEAARRWVRQVGLPSLEQPLPDPVDEYRKGFIDGQIDMRDRPEEQEPVARVIDDETPEGSTEWIPYSGRQVPVKTGDLLYTHPPRREWQGLTEEEREQATGWSVEHIEAALRSKNQ